MHDLDDKHPDVQRPEIVTDEHLEYLDDLRESGRTNMLFGARPYLQDHFSLEKQAAATILDYWMRSFSRD